MGFPSHSWLIAPRLVVGSLQRIAPMGADNSLLKLMQIYQTKKEKILKIIQIVYDIISALFIVFVIVSLAISANQGDKGSNERLTPTIQEVERKSRDNFFINNGYCLASIDEVFSNVNFYTFAFLPQEHFETTNVVGTILTTTRVNVGTRIVKWNMAGISHDDLGYSSALPLRNISYELLAVNTLNNAFVQVWETTINFSETAFNKYYLECYYNSVSGVSYGKSMFGVNITKLDSTNYDFSSLFIAPSSTSFGSWLTDNGSGGSGYNAGYESGKSAGWQEGYNTGYNNGYDLGYAEGTDNGNSSGYDNGYQVGLDAGYDTGYDAGYIAGSQGVESNAFTAIGGAITACAGLFSIQILPNLTLGILLLVPAIITIVIVVIKMIKG